MKLSEIVQRINGNIDRFTTELEFYIGGEHMESSELEISNRGLLKENLGKLGFKFHFAFQERDVLFMARNPHLRKAGMVMFSGLCSDATYVLRSKDENIISQEFLAIQLQTDHFWDYCERTKVGSVNFANNWSSIANYDFDLPPINIQKEVASKVWSAYRVKQSYRKLLNAIDDMVKSQFIEMLKGKAINGTISDLVTPKIANVKKTYSPDDTIQYIDISSINAEDHSVSQITEYSVKDAPSRAQQCVKYGDLLVSTVRPINRNIAIVDKDLDNLVASTGFCVLRPNDGVLNYLLSIILSDDYTYAMCDKANGGVYPAVNNGDVLNYQIHIPDEDLAKRASLVRHQADKSKFELKKSIEAIDKVIKSLINNI